MRTTAFTRHRLLKLGLAVSLLCLSLALHANEPLYVVVSAQSPVRSITAKEVLALYTGRVRNFAGGEPATPLDQQRDSAARESFYLALTGMDIARINSYWARLHFTGQVKPPQATGDDAAMIQRLRADPSAIGYVVRPPADPGVRVLLRLPASDKDKSS